MIKDSKGGGRERLGLVWKPSPAGGRVPPLPLGRIVARQIDRRPLGGDGKIRSPSGKAIIDKMKRGDFLRKGFLVRSTIPVMRLSKDPIPVLFRDFFPPSLLISPFEGCIKRFFPEI